MAENPYLSDKAKNRKPLGRHITKGNFDEIDGGPDIESVYILDDDDNHIDEEDMYCEWNDEDFMHHRASMQYAIKSLDPDTPVVNNLMGTGEEVLNLALDPTDNCPYDKLLQQFETELKILPREKEPTVVVESEDRQPSLITWITRNSDDLDFYINWKFMIPLCFFWQLMAIPMFNFLLNLLPLAMIKTVYDYLKNVGNTRVMDTTTVSNSLSKNILDGKDMLMKAFCKNKEKVFEENRTDMMQDVTAMSTASDDTISSKAFVQGTLRKFKPPKPPPSTLSENELEVPVSRGRIYQDIIFNDVLKVNCLIDLGATSSSVNRSILNDVEGKLGYRLPRLKKTFPVMSFAHEEPQQQECVVMNIKVQGKTETDKVPFLINEASSKVQALIGMNVIRAWGTDISVGDDKDVIAFKKNVLPRAKIQPSMDRKSLNLITAKEVTMYPMESTIIKSTICGDLHASHGNQYLCNVDLENDSDIVSMPFLFTRRGDHLDISAQNIGKTPITLPEGIQIGEVSVINHDIFNLENSIYSMAEKSYFFRNIPSLTIGCFCELRTERSTTVIIFTDEYGISPHYHQQTAGNLPLDDYKNMQSYRKGMHMIYVKPKNGTYPFDWQTLKSMITKKIRIALSFRQVLTDMEKKFIDNLRKKGIEIQVYNIKNTGCTGCMSLGNVDCPDLFRNIDGFKIFLFMAGSQPYDFQRLKDTSSPILEMELGYYCFLQVYRCQGQLILNVHFTDWHQEYHKFRIECSLYTLFSHIRLLKLPQTFSVLTSWDSMESNATRQVKSALQHVQPWDTNPDFKIEDLKSNLTVAPFIIKRCGCRNCRAIIEAKPLMVRKAVMVFSGKLEAVNKTCRVRDTNLNGRVENKALQIMESAARSLEELGKDKHPDDQSNWHGQEEVQQSLNQFPGELDAEVILKDRHVPKPWREALDEKSFDRLGVENKQLLIQILDRYNDMFSHFKGSWRYMNVEPLDLDFNTDTPIVSRPIQMSPIKDRILTSKIMNLIENDLVKIMDHNQKYVTNVSNIFLVPHNSSCQREVQSGKRDPNQVQDIDPSKFRAVVDLREANTTIKNPTQLNYVIHSTTDLLNRMSPFKCYILMDISAAYRSFPVTERTARRFCFRANTAHLRNKVLAFSSLTDGISVAPSVFSHTILKILEPIQTNCLVWIDDVLIMANTKTEALKIFQKALDLLEKANVLINIKKLVVLEDSFEYLGFLITITPDGPMLSVPDSKKEVFARMELPKTRDGIRKILGMVTFIDLMIPGLHCHLGPLIDCLKTSIPSSKNKQLELNEIHGKSFKKITKILDNLTSVHLFRYDQTAYLVTDASLTAAGACLFQLNPDGSRRIIAYYSKRFPVLVQCQKTSIFKEILALFFGITHFYRPYLMGAVKTVLICDLSCIITLLSAKYNPVDLELSRLSFKLFSYGFAFQLRHSPANKDILISDQLSRLHEEPTSYTGLPIGQMKDAQELFKEFKNRIPPEWISGAEFSYSDMIKHLTSEILKDPKISENVRQKRFSNLLRQIDEKWHPPILQFVKNDGIKPNTDVLQTKTLKGKDIEVSVIECKTDRFVQIYPVNAKQDTKLSPPRSIRALNLSHIIRLQRENKQCNRVINHLLTVPEGKQDTKWKKHFKLLDSNLLVTRKSAKKPWDVENLRIYLPITGALYVLAYMHLVSAHIGQNYLAQMFSATYRCFNLTKMVKIISKSCSHCMIYEHKNIKYTSPGRLPRASRPSERVYMDILQIPPGKLSNTTYKYVLGILDDFSGFLNLIPLKDQTTNTVLKELSKLWSTLPTPNVVITDNASNFKTLKFKEPLLNLGVQKVLTTSPNHSTSNSRIERAFKTVRRILFLNLSTFKRESHWDVFYSSLAQFNNTPSWRLAKFTKARVPASPMELFYSQPSKGNLLDDLLGHLTFSEQDEYKKMYQGIIKQFDEDQEKQHNIEIKDMRVKEKSLAPGDIVMVMNPKRIHHEGEAKGKELYLKDLWEIVQINYSKATISPLFFKSRKCEKVFVDHLKKYEPQTLVQILPEEMQLLMGHYHNPETLKRTRRPPSVFERRVPLANFPSLRNRIDVKDNHSIPALRGLIQEDDDFDDYDDPLFPRPGPEYTQIKYDQMIIPDDPNLLPQGQINEDIGVEGDELIGNEAENDEHPRGAANDQRNVTIPQGNGADWEIKDHTLKPDSPNTVVKKINNLANQTKQDDSLPRKNVTINDKYFRRTYELPKEERKFKQGKIPDWDPNKSTKNKIDNQEGQGANQGIVGKFFNKIFNRQQPESYSDVAKRGQEQLEPFRPNHESSPQKPGYQYEEGNVWNQFSPIQNRYGWNPNASPRKSILKNNDTIGLNQSQDTIGENTEVSLPDDSWNTTPDKQWRSGGGGNDSTLKGSPPQPSPQVGPRFNSPRNGGTINGNVTQSPNMTLRQRGTSPLTRPPAGTPPPPPPQHLARRMTTPVRPTQPSIRRPGTPHPNPHVGQPTNGAAQNPTQLRRPISQQVEDDLADAFKNLGTSSPVNANQRQTRSKGAVADLPNVMDKPIERAQRKKKKS